MTLQGKLLRVIEEKEFYRLGSAEPKNVDVRIVAATNRSINEEIKREHFRADLYYRLNTYSIKIPPLRERKKDVLPLVRYFLQKHTTETNKKITAIESALGDFFLKYSFPGNIRELNNIIASAVLVENSDVLTFKSASSFLPKMEPIETTDNELITLAEMEKQHILRILKATGGNRKETAKILGINATTVYRKIEKYDISV